jgi:hypothetical protein
MPAKGHSTPISIAPIRDRTERTDVLRRRQSPFSDPGVCAVKREERRVKSAGVDVART